MKRSIQIILFLFLIIKVSAVFSQKNILIIQDELPQMEVLSKFLSENDKNIKTDIVDQDNLPNTFREYNSVILYIHRELDETTENKTIEYTKNGGRFICLHHSISSKKAQNKNYFPFLGIQLDGTDKANDAELPGAGYAWIDPVVFTLVNLNTQHYITTNKINWEKSIPYQSSDFPGVEREYPAIFFDESEIYLNHKFTDGREKTVLMGLKFFDKRNNQLFMQDRAAWYKKAGKGDIFYFMPGHSTMEFQNKNYSQMILNAINF